MCSHALASGGQTRFRRIQGTYNVSAVSAVEVRTDSGWSGFRLSPRSLSVDLRKSSARASSRLTLVVDTIPHRLAAPPIAGTIRVDVLRAGRWEPIPGTAWALESPCSLRVDDARDGEVVRVRYTREPSGA